MARKKSAVLPACRCLEIPPGTIVRDRRYGEHLVYFSPWMSYDATGYYLCPQTRVVWVSKYVSGRDWRMDDPVAEHTGLVLPEFSHYTVACVEAKLYEKPLEKRKVDMHYVLGVPRHIRFPDFPRLPLENLIFDIFFTNDAGISCSWESLHVSGIDSLKLWLYLLEPLNAGGVSNGWLASPFEPISHQVLQSSLRLEWWQFGKQIGEVVVKHQMSMEASQFAERFSQNTAFRDILQENEEWIRKARRGKVDQ